MWCESGLALGHFLKGKISTVVMIMLLYSSKLYHRALGNGGTTSKVLRLNAKMLMCQRKFYTNRIRLRASFFHRNMRSKFSNELGKMLCTFNSLLKPKFNLEISWNSKHFLPCAEISRTKCHHDSNPYLSHTWASSKSPGEGVQFFFQQGGPNFSKQGGARGGPFKNFL